MEALKAPDDASTALPVPIVTMPEPPADDCWFAVCRVKLPLERAPAPLARRTAPPVPSVESPAEMRISPANCCAAPTLSVMDPALLPPDDPVPINTDPEVPVDEAPEYIETAPLPADDPAVLTDTLPLKES